MGASPGGEGATAVTGVTRGLTLGAAGSPNARNFEIITWSAAAAGSSTSASGFGQYGPMVGRVSDWSAPGGKSWNSFARLTSVPSVRVRSIVKLWAAALMNPLSAIGLV